ncbi:MAG: CocE/NonD family hydrolase C-terminal non-catalytic domain-containing protein [Ktedonobacteraceae bacterium]
MAQVYKTGHRIGLAISSSAFPKYDRNLNTGAPLGVTSEMVVAEHKQPSSFQDVIYREDTCNCCTTTVSMFQLK